MKKIVIYTFILSLITLPIFAKEIDRLALIVNSKAITVYDLKEEALKLAEPLGIKNYSKTDPLSNAELKTGVIEKVISDALIEQEIQKRGLEVPDSSVEMFISNIMRQNGLSTKEQLKSALSMQGLTLEKYRETLKEQIQRTKVMNYAVGSKVNISEKDLKNYYLQNKEEARQSDSIRLKDIFIASNAKNKAAKKKLATDILQKVKTKQSFESLVKKYSEDSNAKTGGDLGFLSQKDFNPQIYDAVKNLKIGQCSNLIETPAGFYIMKVIQRREGQIQEFENVKEDLRKKLTAKETESEFNKWLDDLKGRSYIEIKI